jgi:hypothetical protein
VGREQRTAVDGRCGAGGGALAVLVALVIGVPVGLVLLVGWPLPTVLPSADAIADADPHRHLGSHRRSWWLACGWPGPRSPSVWPPSWLGWSGAVTFAGAGVRAVRRLSASWPASPCSTTAQAAPMPLCVRSPSPPALAPVAEEPLRRAVARRPARRGRFAPATRCGDRRADAGPG